MSGHTWNFGLLLAYPSVSVGFVYHGALQGDLANDFSARSSLGDPIEISSPPGAELRLPRSVGVGVVWRPRPLLRLALDFTHDEWTQYLVEWTQYLVEVPGSSEPAVSGFDGLPAELSATRDTLSVNAGMEKLFPVEGAFVPLRLGFAYEPQGVRDPLLRDGYAFVGIATGTGLNTNSVKLDLALEYRWANFRQSRSISLAYQYGGAAELGLPPPPEAQGTEELREWRLKASVIYRITNTEKLGDFLKRIFGS